MSKVWRTLKQRVHVQHVPFIANYSQDKNQNKDYSKTLQVGLNRNNTRAVWLLCFVLNITIAFNKVNSC